MICGSNGIRNIPRKCSARRPSPDAPSRRPIARAPWSPCRIFRLARCRHLWYPADRIAVIDHGVSADFQPIIDEAAIGLLSRELSLPASLYPVRRGRRSTEESPDVSEERATVSARLARSGRGAGRRCRPSVRRLSGDRAAVGIDPSAVQVV